MWGDEMNDSTGLAGACALAVDIGGTFTDVVLATPGGLVRAKTLTTPGDPVDGFMNGVQAVLDESGVAPSAIGRVIHGTTLATNVVLERRGAPMAYITTGGFRTMLTLGHYARVEEERYDLFFEAPEPPVPLSHCFEVPERVSASGEVLEPLDEDAASRVIDDIAALGVASVAICLLHSYANAAHEERLAQMCRERLGDAVLIVTSSSTWPELREHERACTTVVSAYVGPVMATYLARLQQRLGSLGITAPVQIMESSGGVMSAEKAAARAVYTIESGPAAGVVAAMHVGSTSGRSELISFDMGGTTAKAGVIRDGRPQITHDFHVGGKGSFGGRRSGTGIPVKVPAIDLAEVGAGGGSIAWVDDGGALRVGPRSASADPGPACYGLGGDEPTVTDANVVLGYLDPAVFARGTMTLHPDLAHDALRKRVAEPLGLEPAEAAYAIYEIVNSNMAAAIDVVTIQRGIDPAGFTLVASGGAGPAHIASIAELFEIDTVLVPVASGVASAVGMLATDLTLEHSRTFLTAADAVDLAELELRFAELAAAAAADLGLAPDDPSLVVERFVDMRFRGQAHEHTIPAPAVIAQRADIEQIDAAFAVEYERAYGIRLAAPTEFVSLRVRATQRVPRLETPAPRAAERREVRKGARAAYFPAAGGFTDVAVYLRELAVPDQTFEGPCLIEEPETTVVVPPSWTAAIETGGNLVLRRRR